MKIVPSKSNIGSSILIILKIIFLNYWKKPTPMRCNVQTQMINYTEFNNLMTLNRYYRCATLIDLINIIDSALFTINKYLCISIHINLKLKQ